MGGKRTYASSLELLVNKSTSQTSQDLLSHFVVPFGVIPVFVRFSGLGIKSDKGMVGKVQVTNSESCTTCEYLVQLAGFVVLLELIIAQVLNLDMMSVAAMRGPIQRRDDLVVFVFAMVEPAHDDKMI
jgi:hypothetical protein